MKYLVCSDIHGSKGAAEFALKAFEETGCDAILCLGDVLYHGPRNDLPEDYSPKEVIALLNPYADKIIAVRGNCDAEVDQMVLDFALTADYNEFFLKGRKVFMTHGHVYSPEHHPGLKKGDVFLSGHTHIPTADRVNGIYYLNPGSCGLPKNNHPKTVAVLTKKDFVIYQEDGSPYMSVTFK